MRGTTREIKPKNGFSVFSLSRPRWLAVLATHIPRRPKKKPLRGKKVDSAEKKLRLTQIMAHRVYQGWHSPTYGFLPRPPLSKAHCSGCGFLHATLRLRLRLHGCPQYAISDGGFAPCMQSAPLPPTAPSQPSHQSTIPSTPPSTKKNLTRDYPNSG